MKKILGGVVILILILIWFFIPEKKSVEYNFDEDLLIGDSKILNEPANQDAFNLVVEDEKTTSFEFYFKSSIDSSGFSVFFPGNFHAVSAYLPKNFEVYLLTQKQEWLLVDKIRDYKESSYKLTLDDNTPTWGFKLLIESAAFEKTVSIKDLKIYEFKKVTKFEFIRNWWLENSKSPLGYLILSIIFVVIIFVPGLGVWNKFIQFNNTKFTFIFAPIISICILGLSSLIYFITGYTFLLYIYIVIVIWGIWEIRDFTLLSKIFKEKKLFFLLVTSLLITNLLQMKRDFLFNLNYIEKHLDAQEFPPDDGYYGYHADNTMPWGIARVYLHRVPLLSQSAENYIIGQKSTVIFDRTPLLPLINVPILKVFGESHFVYQRFINVLVSCYFSSTFLLLLMFFRKGISWMSSLAILISGHLSYQVFNSEIQIKFISTYPIFLGIILYKLNEFKYKYLSIGILLGIGYLIHPMSLMFAFLLAIINLINQRIEKTKFINSLKMILPSLLLLFMWTSLSQYTKSNSDYEQSVTTNLYEREILNVNSETLSNKFFNIINFVIPDILGNRIQEMSHFSYAYFSNYFIKTSIVATLTPLLFLLFIWSLFQKEIIFNYWQQIILGVGPFLIFIVMIHKYNYGVHLSYFPFTIPFLLGISIMMLKYVNKYLRLLIILSFPILNFFYVYHLSGTFDTLKYRSLVVWSAFLILISIYLLVSFFLAIGVLSQNFEDESENNTNK